MDKSLVFAVAALMAVIAALAGCLYYLNLNSPTDMQTTPEPTSAVEPFDFQLTVSPYSGTILQGDTIQVNVTATIVQGTPEKVALTAQAPEGTDFAFNPPELYPEGNSTLTIHVSNAVPTNAYNITVTASAENGKTRSAQVVLAVCSSEVTLSGTIGTKAGTVPKQVMFKQLTWEGNVVQTFTAPVEDGRYSIVLPNQWFYAVGVAYENQDGTLETNYFIQPYRVNADVGVTAINCPFSWS